MNEIRKKTNCFALLDRVHISPQKVNLVAELIRKKKAVYAEQLLSICNKKAAFLLKKLIQSALANGVKNFGFNPETLFVERIDVGKSLTLKRLMPRARGKADQIKRRHSRIRMVLGMKSNVQEKKTLQITAQENKVDHEKIQVQPQEKVELKQKKQKKNKGEI